jgi:glycosyltransferase involved in cell wall biosynthesis
MDKIVVLFPSYRPTAIFPAVLQSLRQLDVSTPIVVVDDGSDPVHAAVFDAVKTMPAVTLLRNAVNLGKGAALKHGMNYILLEHPNCIGIVTADADGQHSAKDIIRLRDELCQQPDQMILGCREFGDCVPFRSRFGNVLSRYVYRLLLGLKLSDTQTGLRGIPRRLMAASLHIRANRYEYETEQLIVAKQESLATREIPIQTIYIDDNRASHFNPVMDSFRIYFVLLRYAISSIATAIADFIAFYVLTSSNVPMLTANMSARGFALWIQFMLLKKYVFKTKGGLTTFAAYVAYVFFSGYVSSIAQLQFTAHITQSPLLAKAVVELAIWIFNFMFLRDIIFRRWSEV